MHRTDPRLIVRDALRGTGIEVVGSCTATAYDARAPEAFRSAALLPGARALVVAGSAGPELWRQFREATRREPARWQEAHPYDAFVADGLGLADFALARAGVRFVRFEAAFAAPVRVDFVALAQLAGLGSPGPFGLLIHPEHGPWWALRGAWLVDAETEPTSLARASCDGCSAPCIGGGAQPDASLARATPEVRSRCVVGAGSRYDDDQLAYHYDRRATAARLAGAAQNSDS